MVALIYVSLIILLNTKNGHGLTCQEVLELQKDTKLKELKSLSSKEVVQCFRYLGQTKMDITEANFIWNSIIEFHKTISLIPDHVLKLLRWVTIAVKPEDYDSLTLNNPDVISNFGQDYGLSKEQLLAIANRVRQDFGDKRPEDYTVYDLKVLKQILCVLDGKEIVKIHPKEYKKAALLIGRLKNCNYDVLEGFAILAVDKDAFGPPDKWKRETICILGSVAKYLPENIILILIKKLGTDFLRESDRNITKEEQCEH